jgi:hypothetical protein
VSALDEPRDRAVGKKQNAKIRHLSSPLWCRFLRERHENRATCRRTKLARAMCDRRNAVLDRGAFGKCAREEHEPGYAARRLRTARLVATAPNNPSSSHSMRPPPPPPPPLDLPPGGGFGGGLGGGVAGGASFTVSATVTSSFAGLVSFSERTASPAVF